MGGGAVSDLLYIKPMAICCASSITQSAKFVGKRMSDVALASESLHPAVFLPQFSAPSQPFATPEPPD